MNADDLNYENLTGTILIGHTFEGRTESIAFLAWFLEHVLRLDDVASADAICDGPGDRGIDGIVVDHDGNEIVFLQSKVRQNENRLVGDQPIRDFAGSVAQFATEEAVRSAIATEPNTELSKLFVRSEIAERVAEGYLSRGYFITNSSVNESGRRAAQDLNITIFSRLEIAEQYVEINAPDRVEGVARFDVSDHGYLEFSAGGAAKLYLITARAVDLLELGGISDGSLFAQNVRLNFGRTKVNRDIALTIEDRTKHLFFPMYHNGVTLICRRVDFPNDELLEVCDYVVVNGAQSLSVLYRAREQISDDLRLVVKIVEIVEDDSLAREITLSSNNQNAIKPRDLRSTNLLQTRLQAEFEAIDFEGFRYQIKRGEEEEGIPISNEEAGRLLLAFDVGEPWSCHQIYKVFDEKYSEIFGRRIVNAWRIILLHRMMSRIEAALPGIGHQAIQRYRLTRYFLLYSISKIIDEDDRAKEIFDDPRSLLVEEERCERVLDGVESISRRLCVDLRFELVEDNSGVDYKAVLKSPVQVPMMETKLRKSFLHDVARGREEMPSSAF